MKCPECGCSWISVLESRHTSEKAISRRRQCKGCNHLGTAEVRARTVGLQAWRIRGKQSRIWGHRRMLERLRATGLRFCARACLSPRLRNRGQGADQTHKTCKTQSVKNSECVGGDLTATQPRRHGLSCPALFNGDSSKTALPYPTSS